MNMMTYHQYLSILLSPFSRIHPCKCSIILIFVFNLIIRMFVWIFFLIPMISISNPNAVKDLIDLNCESTISNQDNSYVRFDNELVRYDSGRSRKRGMILPIIDTLYVGISHPMKSLTGDNGLFSYLNQAKLYNPIVVIIDSDLDETGKYTLKRWVNVPSTTHHTVTITTDNQTRTIKNDLNHYNSLLSLDQTQDLIIDGKESHNLILAPFKANSIERSTALYVCNFATNCSFKNLIVLNNQKLPGYGAIHITNSQCKLSFEGIHFQSHESNGTDYYQIAIKCQSGSHQLNIRNCEFTDFAMDGIYVLGSTSSQTITGNHFYRLWDESTIVKCIQITEGKGHIISNNYFGGNEKFCGATMLTLSRSCYFSAISLINTADNETITIANNVCKNIALTAPAINPSIGGSCSYIVFSKSSVKGNKELLVDTLFRVSGNKCSDIMLLESSFFGVSMQSNASNSKYSIIKNEFRRVSTIFDQISNGFFQLFYLNFTATSCTYIQRNLISDMSITAPNKETTKSNGLIFNCINLDVTASDNLVTQNRVDSIFFDASASSSLMLKLFSIESIGGIKLVFTRNCATNIGNVTSGRFGDLTGLFYSTIEPSVVPSNIRIFNNVFRLGRRSLTSSGLMRGVDFSLNDIDSLYFVHNSMSMEGNFSGSVYSDALFVSNTIASLYLRNNLLINQRLNQDGQSLMIHSTNSYPSGLTENWSDYNNILPATALFRVGNTSYTGINNWTNSVLKPDKHSFTINMQYQDSSFLIPKREYYLPCEPFGGVLTDFNGHNRSLSPFKPDIGAFEKVEREVSRWMGTSADWMNPLNWDTGLVPSVNSIVLIPPWAIGFPNLPTGANIELKELNNYSNDPLIVDATSSLTISGNDLHDTTKLQLVLQGSLMSSSSLVTNSLVKIEMIRPIDGYSSWPEIQQPLHGWHLFSSPIKNFGFESFLQDDDSADLYYWDEKANNWINRKLEGGMINPLFGDSFQQGRGYLIASKLLRTIDLTGVSSINDFYFSNLSLTSGNSSSGWHLLGNPYPAGLIWGTEEWTLSGIDNIAKVWSEENAAYIDLFPEQGIIPSLNGFFVHVTSAINNITIPKAERIHNHFYYKSFPIDRALVFSVLDQTFKTRQLIHLFLQEPSESNKKLQSEAMDGYAPQLFFTTLEEDYSTFTSFSKDTLVHLVYHPTNQNTIKIQLKLPSELKVHVELIDEETNIHYKVIDSLEISVKSNEQLEDYHLSLRLQTENNEVFQNKTEVFAEEDCILLKNCLAGLLEIYDLSGKLIQKHHVIESKLWRSKRTQLKGVYIALFKSKNNPLGKTVWLFPRG